MAVTKNRWVWEKTDPSRSGSSGDLSKLFRNERVKNPGALALNTPPDAESLLAREAIQNSWDAAIELRRTFDDCPDFEMTFEFRTSRGAQRDSIVKTLDLGRLARHARQNDRRALGLAEADCLTTLDRNRPLNSLVIEERGTTGMYGRWQQARSKMYLALVSLGYTEKGASAGGSYGFGKAGLVNASGVRTIIAYTCFEQRSDDIGVTRRLLGMTYWGQHVHDLTSLTGFARLGEEKTNEVVPFENEQADMVATALGLEIRDPQDPEDWGTTFLVVDPVVHPDPLVDAIGRWWWPALDEGLFEIAVRTPEGRTLHPRPMQDEVLRSFVKAYRVAVTPQDATSASSRSVALKRSIDGNRTDLGMLGLVSDTGSSGWSYANQLTSISDDADVDHRSLVALMRDPRMVVEYLDVGRNAPFVRGAFIASTTINDTLRASEPKGHDAWQFTPGSDSTDPAGSVAEAVTAAIRYQVDRFRGLIKPAVRPIDEIRLPYFDQFIRDALSGSGKSPSDSADGNQEVSVSIEYQPVLLDFENIKLVGSATYGLTEYAETDEATLAVDIRYRYVDDDRAGDFIPLSITPPEGFEQRGSEGRSYVGRITSMEDVRFEFESIAYGSAWTGRLYANGDLITQEENVSG